MQNDDGLPTQTSLLQAEIESLLHDTYASLDRSTLVLDRPSHVRYLSRGLNGLPASYVSLDASTPWLCFWILQSRAILNLPLSSVQQKQVIETLRRCWNSETGGYGGGPGQLAHLATTYAAVFALLTIGTPEAYDSIDRLKLHDFFVSLKHPSGAFHMHLNGETDVRGAYCVTAVSYTLNILSPPLSALLPSYIRSLQSYEGGLGGCEVSESHGGYTYCGIAALSLLGRDAMARLDIGKVIEWATKRQMVWEGGFQGRVNKLVDGCYGFWVTALLRILESYVSLKNNNDDEQEQQEAKSIITELFDADAVQTYLLTGSQYYRGGFGDRPDACADYYHTCYCLAGLSSAQVPVHMPSLFRNVHGLKQELNEETEKDGCSNEKETVQMIRGDVEISESRVVGDAMNKLEPVHPALNLTVSNVEKAIAYFYRE